MRRHVLRLLVVLIVVAAVVSCRGKDQPGRPIVETPTTPTPPGNPEPQTCSLQVTPGAIVLPRDRWTGEISVDASPGCTWTAAPTAFWLRLRANAGVGPATVTYDADFNPQAEYSARRQARIAFRSSAEQNVDVTQWGDCNTIAGPAKDGLPPGGTFSGNGRLGGTVTVSAQGGRVHLWVLTDPFMGCAWTAESADTWVSWVSPPLHRVNGGDGDLVFTVPPNTSSQTRRATVTVGGWPLTIVQ